MNYESAIKKLDPDEPFAFCVPLLGLPAGANQRAHELLEPARLVEGQKLTGDFDVEEAGKQCWLLYNDQVVLRPAPTWHQFNHGGEHVENKFFYQHELSDPLEVAYRTRSEHFMATRDAKGWTVGLGAQSMRGATLDEALRKLVRAPERREDCGDA